MLFSLCGGYFFVSYLSTSAFLGEDLGLDIYKNIDEGLYDLELKQYEYELSGHGEADVSKVVGDILKSEWLECDIGSIRQMEDIVGWPNPIWTIQLSCNEGKDALSVAKITAIKSKLSDVKTTFSQRAQSKSKKIYEIARIGLYSDGSEENSPFDLMVDLEDIDRVIFSEEIEYNGEEFNLWDEELFDFLTEDKGYLADEREREEEDIEEDTGEDVGSSTGSTSGTWGTIITPSDENEPLHQYACLPSNETGLDDDVLGDIENDFGIYDPRRPRRPDIPIIEDDYYVYSDGEYSNGTSWWGPFRWAGPNGAYAWVTDAWNCDSFFCIVIEFVTKKQNLLWWGQTTSIESILEKANEHFTKFANTSLAQSKMTTNNFELGLIIPNLGDMLRGFGIQIQTKPAPILNIEQDEDKKDKVKGDRFTAKNMLSQYYKNIGLDYDRKNDLDIINKKINIKQILQNCTEQDITCPVNKLQELEKFQEKRAETNEKITASIDKKALQEDAGDFYKQFVELERFVSSIDDFSTSISGMIHKMKKIPTRKS